MISAYGHYLERCGLTPAPMLADYARAIRREEVFVLGEPICGVIVLVPQADHLLLENVAVLPDRQGQGLGGALMRFAEDHARERGLPEIQLYTGECMWENLRLYPKLGYVEFDRRVDNRYPRVYFSKAV